MNVMKTCLQVVKEVEPQIKDWGISFMADTELDALRIAYAYTHHGESHGAKIEHFPALGQFMVTVWNEKAKAMGCAV